VSARAPVTVPWGRRARWMAWVFGLIALFAVVGLTLQVGQVERFLQVARRLAPGWILVAFGVQLATYACLAGAWRLALVAAGFSLPLPDLVSLAVQQLFVDQAVPSAGISGDAYFVGALRARQVPATDGAGVLLMVLVTHYAAYVANALGACAVLQRHGVLQGWMKAVAIAFLVFCLTVPTLLLAARRYGARVTSRASRVPRLGAWLASFAGASTRLLHRPGLLIRLALLDAAIVWFDALTLWVLLHAVGATASLAVAYASVMLALMAAMLGPFPLGLGAFEATCVAALVAQHVPIEASLVGTLLLRGWTTWLPMLPGLALMRREMRRRTRDQSSRASPEDARPTG